MTRIITTFLAMAGPVLVVACGTSGASTAAPVPRSSPAARGGHAIKTVFLILMENHNWSSVGGNRSEAPYINKTLLPLSSYASQYYNPPDNHPSLPNYLWLEGGQCYSYCGTDSSPSPSPGGIPDTRHLVSLLRKAHISWKAYVEGISDGSCPLTNAYPYAAKHNPFVYFDDVSGNRAYCAAHERPYSRLAADLRNRAVGRYNFITPDLCHDMHDSCPPTNDSIKQGDAFLSRAVATILHSAAYRSGGAIFITWDEGEGSDGPIGMIVISPDARGRGYHNTIRYTHSSTLRTMEEIFGVKPFLGDARRANDLRDLFVRFP